jgi:hypothetical protein
MSRLVAFPGVAAFGPSQASKKSVWLIVVPGWLPLGLTSQDYADKLAQYAGHALQTAGHTITVR